MGESIAPEVDANIIDMCDDETCLTSYELEDNTIKELHAPLGNVTLKRGFLFVAVLVKSPETVRVEEVGHFDYAGSQDGLPSFNVLFEHYWPIPEDENLTTDEQEFVEALQYNQYKFPYESLDWEKTVFTGDGIIGKTTKEEYRRIGETIYPNDTDFDDREVDFTPERRDELVEATIEVVTQDIQDTTTLSDDGPYVKRTAKFQDFHERAKELYLNAPPVTQTQAVSWALRELTLNQDQIATLRGKTQPTISNHIERAGTHYVQAKKTAAAFGDMPAYMNEKAIENIEIEIETEEADERFRLEKSKKAEPLKCPDCELDAGDWDGGTHSGDWVEEPTKFWVGKWSLKSRQAPRDPRWVECSECGHQARYNKFETEWTDEHGPIKHDGPEPL